MLGVTLPMQIWRLATDSVAVDDGSTTTNCFVSTVQIFVFNKMAAEKDQYTLYGRNTCSIRKVL